MAISTVREFDQIDVPDVKGSLNSRLEAYGAPGAVHPRNLYEAQRSLRITRVRQEAAPTERQPAQ